MADRVYLFDTTLRDGAQTQGVDFTVADKAAIATALDEIGRKPEALVVISRLG